MSPDQVTALVTNAINGLLNDEDAFGLADLADAVAFNTYLSGATEVARDSFTRATGAIGSAELGGAWTAELGAAAISNNTALASAANTVLMLPSGLGGMNVAVAADILIPAGSTEASGITARYGYNGSAWERSSVLIDYRSVQGYHIGATPAYDGGVEIPDPRGTWQRVSAVFSGSTIIYRLNGRTMGQTTLGATSVTNPRLGLTLGNGAAAKNFRAALLGAY